MVESVPKSVLAAVFPKTVDYETTKRLIVTVRVTDANSHTFSKNFTFTIADPNSNNNSPTDIILSIGNSTDNHTIAENL
jgi:hypothetical protein